MLQDRGLVCLLLAGLHCFAGAGVAQVMQVAVVTGGNRGIGLQVIRELTGRNLYQVVLACRDPSQGKEAVRSLPGKAQGMVEVMQLDVQHADSRQKFVEELASKHRHIDLLINNAGIYVDGWTQENFDSHMQINAIGPLDLTKRVVERFVEAEATAAGGACSPLHVVGVSSGYGELSGLSSSYRTAVTGSATVEDLANRIRFNSKDPIRNDFVAAYKVSKAALNHGSVLQAKAYAPLGVSVATICPGWVRTDMGGSSATRSVEEGAASVLATALAEDKMAVSGGYFRDGKPIKP